MDYQEKDKEIHELDYAKKLKETIRWVKASLRKSKQIRTREDIAVGSENKIFYDAVKVFEKEALGDIDQACKEGELYNGTITDIVSVTAMYFYALGKKAAKVCKYEGDF